MTLTTTKGLVELESRHSVDDTVTRLLDALQEQAVKVFAVIDHSAEAEKVGLKMPPTKLVIFGSPKAGTPLMLAAPTIAIDLPLKILVREHSDAKVWVSYNEPAYLRERHGLPASMLASLEAAKTFAAHAAG
jgi:uncharacterized protein (DUF302 family)